MRRAREFSPDQDPYFLLGAADTVMIRATRVSGSQLWQIHAATGVYTEVRELFLKQPDGTLRRRFYGMKEKQLPGLMWDEELRTRPGGDLAVWTISDAVGEHVRELRDNLLMETDTMLD
jgi:hypothetical protein